MTFYLTLTFSLPPSICSLPYLCPSHLVFLSGSPFCDMSSLWFGIFLFQNAGTLNFVFNGIRSDFSLPLSLSLMYFYIVLPPSSSHICMNDVCISSISNRNGCKKTKEGRGTKGLFGERRCHSHMLSVALLFLSPLSVPKVDFCFHILDLIGQPLAAAVSPLSSKFW